MQSFKEFIAEDKAWTQDLHKEKQKRLWKGPNAYDQAHAHIHKVAKEAHEKGEGVMDRFYLWYNGIPHLIDPVRGI